MSRALSRPLVLVLVLVLGSRAARAAPKDADTAIDDAAKARYAEGVRLFKKHRYEEARAAFLQASALRRQPMTTLMLAEAELKSGHFFEAARDFDAYTAEASDIPPKLAELIDSGRREARAHLARLRFDVPPGSEITIDGESAALDAAKGPTVDVSPGVHTVIVTLPGAGGETKRETVEVEAGRTATVHPSFAPKALVPAEDTRSRPTPAPPPPRVAAGEPSSGSILSPPETTWPVYAAGAIGLGGLGAAAIFGGLGANASHAIDVATQTLTRNGKSPSSCASGSGWATAAGQNEADERAKYEGACSTLSRNQNLQRSASDIFTPALIVGVSGTLAAAAWFFFAPKEHASSDEKPGAIPTAVFGAWALPGRGPGGDATMGATVSGAF